MPGSPQPAPRGRPTREAFLDATGMLLRRRGYAATGLAEIVELSGAPRGSLYFHFPGGKEELAVASMERAAGALAAAIRQILAGEGDTEEVLGALIDALAAGLRASGFRDGCPIATVALEAASESEPLRLAAERAFESWTTPIEERLLASGLDPAAAARRAVLVLSAIEGALILARARRDVAPLTCVREELAALLG